MENRTGVRSGSADSEAPRPDATPEAAMERERADAGPDPGPESAAAWNARGLEHGERGELWLAIHSFEGAARHDPTCADARRNLGDALARAGALRPAASAYAAALRLRPDDAGAIAGLAAVYCEGGLCDAAIEAYARAVELSPDFVAARCNLADALERRGRRDEAEACLRGALELDPRHPESLNNLANLERERGRDAEAAELYLRALEARPAFSPARCNYASLLRRRGRLREAIAHYEEAARATPRSADALCGLGGALAEAGDLAGAVRSYGEALEEDPLCADAHASLGDALREAGRVAEASLRYRTALALRPDSPGAFCSLVHCCRSVCDWSDYGARVAGLVAIVARELAGPPLAPPSVHPHHSMLYPLSRRARREIAARHASLCAERNAARGAAPLPPPPPRPRGRVLRVGYASADFGDHPTSHLMQRIPGLHDRSRVEVYCYALAPDDGSSFRETVARGATRFVDLSKVPDDAEAAAAIRADGVDVLVNMSGYTKGARNEIFALRPAPLQVMWLGYPGTSGAPYVDYVVVDSVACPPRFAEEFAEKFARMPGSFFVGDHEAMFPHLRRRFVVRRAGSEGRRDTTAVANAADADELARVARVEVAAGEAEGAPAGTDFVVAEAGSALAAVLDGAPEASEGGVRFGRSAESPRAARGEEVPRGALVTARSHYGLPDGAVVFCNFNQLYKIDPDAFDSWAAVLRAAPCAVLWLLRFPAEGEPNLRAEAERRGVCPSRLVFSDPAPKEEHVRRGQLADACLDAFSCSGHTTGMDALWTGTPVVTLPGETLASRVAASQLCAMGLRELVAEDRAHYEAIATRLALDPERLRRVRARTRRARDSSSLFDCARYARDLGALLLEIRDRRDRGLDPDHVGPLRDQ